MAFTNSKAISDSLIAATLFDYPWPEDTSVKVTSWDRLTIDVYKRNKKKKTEYDYIGTQSFSAICRMSVSHEYQFDKPKSKSFTPYKNVPTGLNPRVVNASLQAVNATQFAELQEFVQNILQINQDDTPFVFKLIHPQATHGNISYMFVKSINIPPPNANDGFIVEISFVETEIKTAKPPKSNKKTAGDGDGTETPVSQTPTTPTIGAVPGTVGPWSE